MPRRNSPAVRFSDQFPYPGPWVRRSLRRLVCHLRDGDSMWCEARAGEAPSETLPDGETALCSRCSRSSRFRIWDRYLSHASPYRLRIRRRGFPPSETGPSAADRIPGCMDRTGSTSCQGHTGGSWDCCRTERKSLSGLPYNHVRNPRNTDPFPRPVWFPPSRPQLRRGTGCHPAEKNRFCQ